MARPFLDSPISFPCARMCRSPGSWDTIFIRWKQSKQRSACCPRPPGRSGPVCFITIRISPWRESWKLSRISSAQWRHNRQIMSAAKIGIIGGSGLYQMPELTDVEEMAVQTPFGDPSDKFILGTLEGERVAFLPRHGVGHRYTPTEVPFRANIYGMKLLGVERILSASAVGSLQEKYAPLDMVIPDQFFDRTRARARESTFFGEGIVAHVAFAHPVCSELGDVLEEACKVTPVKVHRRATYLCMEGPAFSTKAESEVYRSWGMSVIGMTNLQEAKLA